ncbi:MAG: hypothetical protein Q9187_006718 [Circinaria calcarea]
MTSSEWFTEAWLRDSASSVWYSQPKTLAAGIQHQDMQASSVKPDLKALKDEVGKHEVLKAEDLKAKDVEDGDVKVEDMKVGEINGMNDNEDEEMDDGVEEDEQMASSQDESAEDKGNDEPSNEGNGPEQDAKDLEEARRDDDRIEEEDLWVREVRFRDAEGLWVYNERRRWFELRPFGMPFPLFELPRELRDKIYRMSFRFTKPTIYPDPTGSLRRHNCTVIDTFTVPLLQSCKTIYDEASAVLYGGKTICFTSDEAPCCAYIAPISDFTLMESTFSESREDIHNSGITEMYLFMRLIGLENRMKIRRLSVVIKDFRLCYYPGEYSENLVKRMRGGITGNLEESLVVDKDAEHNEKNLGTGRLLGDTLELLKRGHNLQTLGVVLEEGNQEINEDMPIHFFRKMPESRLLRQMAEVKGLSSFTCKFKILYQNKSAYAFQKGVFDLLKQEMTKPKPTSEGAVGIEDTSSQLKAAALCKKILAIEEKREDLVKKQTADGSDKVNLLIQEIDGLFESFTNALDKIA